MDPFELEEYLKLVKELQKMKNLEKFALLVSSVDDKQFEDTRIATELVDALA